MEKNEDVFCWRLTSAILSLSSELYRGKVRYSVSLQSSLMTVQSSSPLEVKNRVFLKHSKCNKKKMPEGIADNNLKRNWHLLWSLDDYTDNFAFKQKKIKLTLQRGPKVKLGDFIYGPLKWMISGQCQCVGLPRCACSATEPLCLSQSVKKKLFKVAITLHSFWQFWQIMTGIFYDLFWIGEIREGQEMVRQRGRWNVINILSCNWSGDRAALWHKNPTALQPDRLSELVLFFLTTFCVFQDHIMAR